MREGLIDLAELERSPFLDDVGPADRHIGRLILTIVAGLVGAVVIAGFAAVVGVVIYFLVQASNGVGVEQIQAELTKLLDPKATPTFASTLGILAFLAVANGLFFGSFTLIAALINKRPIKSYFTAAPRFRWRMLGLGLLLFCIVIGPVLALDTMINGHAEWPVIRLAHTFGDRVLYVLAAVVALVIAAGVEELLCRGWLLKQTAAWSKNFWVLIVVNGLLFSAMHLPDTDPNAFIGRALMGMGFVYMTLRTGGIEFSTGAHAANNLLLLLFVQTPPLAPPPPEKFSALAVLPTLLAVIGYVIITEIVVRWTPLREWGRALVRTEPAPAAVF